MDNIVITWSSPSDIDQLINALRYQFSLRNLGQLSYFLGVEVSYSPSGDIFLSQQKYIYNILQRTKMSEANSLSTPMPSAFMGNIFHDVHLYRSTVGSLQYVTRTRPEITGKL